MMMVSLVWARDPPLTKASTPHPSAEMTRSFRIISSLLPQDLLLRLSGIGVAVSSAEDAFAVSHTTRWPLYPPTSNQEDRFIRRTPLSDLPLH
jgi:hypothetical protein